MIRVFLNIQQKFTNNYNIPKLVYQFKLELKKKKKIKLKIVVDPRMRWNVNLKLL